MTSADLTDPGELTVLYRGPLASCNYGCGYCPFAKHDETPEERDADTAALARFVAWAEACDRPLRIFFTPWGEALHRLRYREAIVRLSRLDHVRQVAVQTNLAGSPAWLADADTDRVAIWATWHPTEVSLDRFLGSCAVLDQLGVAYSVGVVGRRDAIDDIEEVRRRLDARVPVWVNAYSTSGGPVRPGYYSADDVARLRAVDPLFEAGLHRYRSQGQACATGETVISVDGDGEVTRCHFVPRRLGNLYDQPLDEMLAPRRCPKMACDCHIGYVHLEALDARGVYGDDGLVPRIPLPDADVRAYLARAQGLALTRRTRLNIDI